MWRVALLGMGLGCLLVAGLAVVSSNLLSGAGPATAGTAGEGLADGDLSVLLPGDEDEPAVPPEPAEAEPAADPEPAEAEPAESHDALVAHLDGLLDRDLPARFGFALVDPDGRVVYDRNGDVPMIPASTQKLVTAATALETLGGDARLRTRLVATGPVTDGVVDGDLVILGAGDPALGDPRWGRVVPSRPRTPLESLAEQVAAAGIREVNGQVVGEGGVLPWQPEAAGWRRRYLRAGHATRSSGLTVNGGRRLWERGGQLHAEVAASPALETARSLHDLFADEGVTVHGPAGVTDEGVDGDAVAAVASPDLHTLLRHAVRTSDNHLADQLWRVIGRVDGDGSWAAGGDAARDVLAGLGVDLEGAAFADGSGLSRDDRLTARQLATLDAAMARAHGDQWDELKAVAAEAGTLRRRLHGTMAAGALHGKTGTLSGVRALAGSVHGPHGRWHFAVLGNELDRPGIHAVRTFSDELAVALARHTRRCDLDGC